MTELHAGRSIILKYDDDDNPDLWQERVLLAKGRNGIWNTLTPDEDFEKVKLSKHEYRLLPPDRSLPRGIRERDCYLVYQKGTPRNFFTPPELKRLIAEGRDMLDLEGTLDVEGEDSADGAAAPPPRRGRGRAASPAAVKAEIVPAAAAAKRLPRGGAGKGRKAVPKAAAAPEEDSEIDLTLPLEALGMIWITVEPLVGMPLGTVVPAPAAALAKGTSGLSRLRTGSYVCAKQMRPRDVEGYLARLQGGVAGAAASAEDDATHDARTLPIKANSLGRHRDFTTLAENCCEEIFDDWPLTGPRSVQWCLQFLRKRRCPLDHHMVFRTVTKLSHDAWGMAEHEHLCQMVELAGCYDQLDLTNLAFAEALFRRIQVIEWVHHERVRDIDAIAGDRITVEELSAFSGTARTSDVLMVSPLLLTHVKSVVETDVTIMKSVRKAREERELRRKPPKGPKGAQKGKAAAADEG